MILIIDGQGGGIGRALTEKIRAALPMEEIIVVGTNSGATVSMMKAGATAGATGENAVCYNSMRADIIAGPIGILLANSMYGEISPKMALAVSESNAQKVLIPISKSNVTVAGHQDGTLAQYLEDAVRTVVQLCQKPSGEVSMHC